MPKAHISSAVESVDPNILALKPRQLLLSQPSSSKTTTSIMKKEDNTKPNPTLSPSQRDILVRCVAQFLQRSGFSKTLKKLRSEAKFEEDNFGDCLFDLEVVFLKYLEICGDGSKDIGSNKGAVSTDPKPKEKQKEKKKADSLVQEEQLTAKVTRESTNNNACGLLENKEKNKKKVKLDSEPRDGNTIESKLVPDKVSSKEKIENAGLVEDANLVDSEMQDKKKQRKQKKEKKKLSSDEQVGSQKEAEAIKLNDSQVVNFDSMNVNNPPLRDKNSKTEAKKEKRKDNGNSDMFTTGKPNQTEEHALDKHGTASKKRKRQATGKDDAQSSEEKPSEEESKRRKTSIPVEAELSGQEIKSTSSGKSEVNENGQLGSNQSKNASPNHIDGHANGYLKENGDKSVGLNSIKKPRKGSLEPTSANRFQRINVDEVVFSDERLQDNSYWAKDGAECGYGAKAQEVLGQVRGKGFRHEKTKKKRGTYKGGQIDLHSHSVKFNYSDEE